MREQDAAKALRDEADVRRHLHRLWEGAEMVAAALSHLDDLPGDHPHRAESAKLCEAARVYLDAVAAAETQVRR